MNITLKINAIGIPALGEASAKQTDNKSDSDERNRTASTTIGATKINAIGIPALGEASAKMGSQ